MGKQLWQRKKAFENASVVQRITSKYQRKINLLKVKLHAKTITVSINKKIMFRQSEFTKILLEEFPETREKVKKIFLERYGKSPGKRELLINEINKIKKLNKVQYLVPELMKEFRIPTMPEEAVKGLSSALKDYENGDYITLEDLDANSQQEVQNHSHQTKPLLEGVKGCDTHDKIRTPSNGLVLKTDDTSQLNEEGEK